MYRSTAKMANNVPGSKGDGAAVVVSVEMDYEKCSQEEALKALGADPETGLSEKLVPGLRERYGPNRLPEKKTNQLLKFLGFMWNPLSW